MEELSPTQILDAVLLCMEKYRSTRFDFITLHRQLLDDTDLDFFPVLMSVLLKLEKDGYIYIRKEYFADKTDSYLIAFEGRIFNEQGGYTTKKIKDETKIVFDKILNIALGTGTTLAGIYYAGKIILWLYQHSIYCGCN